MAMMDNRAFLISHIRNSFITSDDTGMCEVIIESDEVQDRRCSRLSSDSKKPTSWDIIRKADEDVSGSSSVEENALDSDTELSHSYDILPDMDFSSHRRRSNTAQRLEKLKRDKHKQSKIQHIAWRDVDHTFSDSGDLFEKKTLPPPGTQKKRSRMSSLSEQLDHFADIPNNPFMEYAKYDGRAAGGLQTKKIDIFLSMAPPEQRAEPMTVVTLATAKVHDLIGLICWQHMLEGKLPVMKERLDSYALHIAEDDGEVDMDFPALDNREPISKFGFAKLALVEKETSLSSPKTSTVITINMPNRGFSKIPLEIDSILMRDILSMVLKRRRLKQIKGMEYYLEKQRDPGTAIDLDNPLSAMDTLEFCMVRENSVRGDIEKEETVCSMSEMAESLSSHQYRSYRLDMLHKLRTSTEVQLGISGEKIEIDPVSGKGLLFKEKAVTHDIETIAGCTLLGRKSAGKASFRLVYHVGHDFRHHDFECDSFKAKEIVQKVNNILEMRSSPVRKDYLAHKEKKLQKRHTLHL